MLMLFTAVMQLIGKFTYYVYIHNYGCLVDKSEVEKKIEHKKWTVIFFFPFGREQIFVPTKHNAKVIVFIITNQTESKLKSLGKMQFRYFLTEFSVKVSQFWAGAYARKGMAKQKPTCGE